MTHKVKREFNDKELIEHPGMWPCWPALPLKHRAQRDKHGLRLCGLLMDEGPLASVPGLSVYLANLYDLPDGREAWDKARYKTYANAGELLADGWEVD